MNTEKAAPLKAVNLASKTPLEGRDGNLQQITESGLLQLHQKLLGSLDIQPLINQYHSWLNDIQRADSVEYSHNEENIALTIGEAKVHQANYVLRLEKTYLGTITISSQKRFSEQDLFDHEQSMAVLVHYLKNAIDFRALQKVALYDALTGVMNRSSLDDFLPREVNRAQRYETELSIMMIDIDHFKSINDRIGHMGGDEILSQVAKSITGSLRSSDMAFRFGGDEFLILLPNTNLKGAHTAAEHIAEALAKSNACAALYDVKPQLSIGVASYRKGESHEDLVRRADSALYSAKSNGRNCIC